MKSGANRIDQNRIAELAHKGLSVEDVSEKLQIVESAVEAFWPDGVEVVDGEDIIIDDEDEE